MHERPSTGEAAIAAAAGGPQPPPCPRPRGPSAALDQRPRSTPASGLQLVVCRPSADVLTNGLLRRLGTFVTSPRHCCRSGSTHCIPWAVFQQAHLHRPTQPSHRPEESPVSPRPPWRGGRRGPRPPRQQWWAGTQTLLGKPGPGLPEDTGSRGRRLAERWKQSCCVNLHLRARAPAAQALRPDLPGPLPRAHP